MYEGRKCIFLRAQNTEEMRTSERIVCRDEAHYQGAKMYDVLRSNIYIYIFLGPKMSYCISRGECVIYVLRDGNVVHVLENVVWGGYD